MGPRPIIVYIGAPFDRNIFTPTKFTPCGEDKFVMVTVFFIKDPLRQ